MSAEFQNSLDLINPCKSFTISFKFDSFIYMAPFMFDKSFNCPNAIFGYFNFYTKVCWAEHKVVITLSGQLKPAQDLSHFLLQEGQPPLGYDDLELSVFLSMRRKRYLYKNGQLAQYLQQKLYCNRIQK